MNINYSKNYVSTAIVAIALASMLVLSPSLASAVKGGNVHVVGSDPTISCPGTDTCTSSPFKLAGLGKNQVYLVSIEVSGFATVECIPYGQQGGQSGGGKNAPGLTAPGSGSSEPTPITSDDRGNVLIGQQFYTLQESDINTQGICSQGKFITDITSITATSATLVITDASGRIVFQT